MICFPVTIGGCSDADSLPGPESAPDVVSGVEDSDDTSSDLDVDSEGDVPMLETDQLNDVEEAVDLDTEDSSDVEDPADVNLEDEPPLDEDPTRFGADAFSAAFIPSYQIP